MDLNIKEILRGTEVGDLQTVGNMQVIPLLSDMEYTDLIAPQAGGKYGTTNYGSMVFRNETDKTMIIPNHTTVITKEKAQDHAMMHAGIVEKKTMKTYHSAACVQQTQGGYISKQSHEIVILPHSLREVALDKRDYNSYDKIWPEIRDFNARCAANSSHGHLEYFFNQYQNELDEFVAEFEVVPRQIGAIILVDGTVVGVERAPTQEYWKQTWKPLIRGCYGALSIERSKQNSQARRKAKDSVDKIRTLLDINSITDLDSLERELSKAEESQAEKAKTIVRDLLDDSFEYTKDEYTASLERGNVSHKQFTGQIVRKSDAIVYASLITKKRFIESDDWYKAKNFTI